MFLLGVNPEHLFIVNGVIANGLPTPQIELLITAITMAITVHGDVICAGQILCLSKAFPEYSWLYSLCLSDMASSPAGHT